MNDTEFETWFAGEVAAPPGVDAVALGGWLRIDGRQVDLHYRDLDEVTHSRLAAQGVWATNEKRMIARAGLDPVAEILRTGGSVTEYLDAAASVISGG